MIEIETERDLISLMKSRKVIENVAFQGINFLSHEKTLKGTTFKDCLFVGCIIPPNMVNDLLELNFIFPSFKLPYPTHPVNLYSVERLYFGFDPSEPESYEDTLDARVYQHFLKTGKDQLTIRESLGRRLHDHGITNALNNFLLEYDPLKVVAIMGGHGIKRHDPMFATVARLSALLCKQGYLMISGGGPGAMEATHFGVWMAERSEQEWKEALEIMELAPSYDDTEWLSIAFKVMEKFPCNHSISSLGIPTWLYGHEPPTPFASHIAKYFANSVREDGLLAIAKGGIIFSPGSAGTIQEIFQDATQNHYLTEGVSSPMIFLDKTYWEEKYPIYPLLKKLVLEGKYKNLDLGITDDIVAASELITKAQMNQNA